MGCLYKQNDAEPKHEAAALNILLVDDDPSLLVLTSRVLRRLGHHVRAVANPFEALALMAQTAENENETEFDVAIVDFRMPWKNGLELASELRTIDPNLPILVTSSSELETASMRAAKSFKDLHTFVYESLSLRDIEASLKEKLRVIFSEDETEARHRRVHQSSRVRFQPPRM